MNTHVTNNNVPTTVPLANWLVLCTNAFNADGTFNYTNAIDPARPAEFSRVTAVT